MSTGLRVAVISDSVDHVDGISIGLRRLCAAATRAGHTMTLIGPGTGEPIVDDVIRIPAAMSAALPMYPQYTWSVPQLPPLTAHLARTADLVQLATPGPMGLAGLIAARMLGLPVLAQYHTEVPEYAARMTGLPFVKDLVGPFVGWFYQQADLCLAPSQTVADRLASLGVAPALICRVRRGVDLGLFDPARRDRGVLARFGIAADAPVALYVGRLSREKNLDGLRAAWLAIHAARPDARLLVAGDGPQPTLLDAGGVIRTGVLHGEELATVFASADVFAFASETETFGNVVVEAAASGLPAVVAATGAAHEHVLAGETGVVTQGSEAFAREVLALFSDPARRARMSVAARNHALSYDLDAAVAATWDIYHAAAAATRARVAS
jgi:glycosyltransferase involved in cell wall biosynthesis